jgi:hypothetical protein
MNWSDWPIACWALSTLLCVCTRRWTDATVSACFAVHMLLDRWPPAAIPAQLKYVFLLAGVAIVVVQLTKEYRRYKESLLTR